MTERTTSVAMTAGTHEALLNHLMRPDGQEDVCLATFRRSTGMTRVSALVKNVILPNPGERLVHGNATVTGDYVLRAADMARDDGCGLVLLHSHPEGVGWQSVLGLDRDAESSYANLGREITGLPLVGMTLAGGDETWSARHWDVGNGRHVHYTESTNVRVIGDRLAVSWNDALAPPPRSTKSQIRTVSAWGERCQADLARRRVLVVGVGSVGLDVFVRLAASGICRITVMDFDITQAHNMDRLIGAKRRDASLKRPKVHIAEREASQAATAANPRIDVSGLSICEPQGLRLALDHDIIFSCVDRPWPRAVLNGLAYADLIPVIDGGIGIDNFDDESMRNATWRSHVIRPGRPCMSCNGQLEPGEVMLDKQGLLEDPRYLEAAGRSDKPASQNVAPLSINVAASLLAQYVSYSVAPGGFGDPGPLRYSLSTHFFEHLNRRTRPHCQTEPEEGVGNERIDLTDRHERAEQMRQKTEIHEAKIRFLRWIDNMNHGITRWLDRN